MPDKKTEEVKGEKPANESAQKVAELEKQKNEYLAGWQRARADFLNYKKEEMERVRGLLEYANEEWILKLLPILDNFETCEKCLTCDPEKDKNVKGLLMMKKQLQDFLKNQGAEEIKTVGQKFDPNLHEVIGEVEAKDKEKGMIIEEVQKGYKINSRLLRPAKVKIVK
jgi:molecular chaperone GrpE